MPLADLERDFGEEQPKTGLAALERDLGPEPAPESTLGKVARIAGEELVKTPGRMIEGVKNALTGAAETFANPKPSTTLPLTLGPGSTIVSRLGSIAAGKMMDQPSTDWWENLKTGAKGVVGDWEKPMTMLTSPAAMEAAFPAAGKVFRSTAPGARAVNAADARNFGETAADVAPTLKPGTTANAMQRTAEGQGLARIGAGKEAAVQDAEAAIKMANPTRTKGEIPIPSMGSPYMPLRDANAELSSIGDQMRGIKPLDPRFPKDVNLKVEYGKLAEDIKNGIATIAGPDAAAKWTAAQGAYRAGREISGEMLSRPNLFRQGEFTMAELQRWLKNPTNRADLARSLGGDLSTGQNLGAYNRLVGEITRGAEPGMVDQLAGRAPGLFSGRGSYGSWRVPLEAVRRVLPNASSSYVGRVPYSPSPATQTIADILTERTQ